MSQPAEIERLTAIRAIEDLKARYFRTLDTKDWAAYRAVFADDLVADFRASTMEPDEANLTHGADAYVAGLAPVLEGVVTVHHGHMSEIVIHTPTTAWGIWAMEDKLWPGEGSVLPFRFMHGYGHYHETYVKQDDGWRIQSIRLTRLRIDIA